MHSTKIFCTFLNPNAAANNKINNCETKWQIFTWYPRVWLCHQMQKGWVQLVSAQFKIGNGPQTVFACPLIPLYKYSMKQHIERILGEQQVYYTFLQRFSFTTWNVTWGLPDTATTDLCKLNSKYCNVFMSYRLMYSSLLGLEGRNIPEFEYISSLIRRNGTHPHFGRIFDFEVFNHFDSAHSVPHILKFSVSNSV